MLGLDAELIYRIPALLVALTVHEYAHAVVADSLGDPTPRYTGRLTMNPVAHIDILGLFALFVVGFGWAKPVQVNPSYFRDGRRGMMSVAFAGPGSNLLLAFTATLLIAFLAKLGIISMGVYKFLFWMQLYNIWFALFNMLPIPPLDGSKILISMLPGKQAYALLRIEPYSQYLLLAFIFLGFTRIIIQPIAQYMLWGMRSFANFIF